MKKILIIEDDQIIASAIATHLISWGYDAIYIKDFMHVIDEIENMDPHLVLLDINLPYQNGYHLCKQIREFSQIPIIFISSAYDNLNIVMAMNMGADDFIAKPFDMQVLSAKVSALLRRAYDFSLQNNLLVFRGLTLDLQNATLCCDEKSCILSRNEFIILKILMQSVNSIVSRDTLMNELWQNEEYVDDNTLSVNVTRLRKKISDLGQQDIIQTRKKLGYIIHD